MDTKELKKILVSCFEDLNFEKKGAFFYKRSKDLVISVGLQKSLYENGYYINVGYIIIELHPMLEFPKYADGDARTRFIFGDKNKADIVDVERCNSIDLIKTTIQNNVKKLIDIPLKKGFKELLKIEPTILYQTTLKAKEYLEII